MAISGSCAFASFLTTICGASPAAWHGRFTRSLSRANSAAPRSTIRGRVRLRPSVAARGLVIETCDERHAGPYPGRRARYLRGARSNCQRRRHQQAA